MTDKLKEQVTKTLSDEAAATNGESSGETGQANGHDTNGDVEMSNGNGDRTQSRERSPLVQEIKFEQDADSDLVSPAEGETIPPVPGIFRIADLKREVEAVRDRRRMMRLGAGEDGKASSPILPSALAVTVFDGGEK
jgi:transcription initiation factor TFIID subunit 5